MAPRAEDLLLRLVVQRCSQAEVVIEGRSCGVLGRGLLVLFGVGLKEGVSSAPLMPTEGDTNSAVAGLLPSLEKCVDKLVGLRVFSDEAGKMNLGLKDAGGGLYLVSQFTLYGDARKGFRPSFTRAAPPAIAERLFEAFVRSCQAKADGCPVYQGEFAADMAVSLINDGPVTILLDADAKGFL